MDNDKFELILDRLLQRTEEGKIEWEKTAKVNSYLLVLKNSSVSMTYLPDKGYFIFEFRNENGDVVELVHADIISTSFNKADKILRIVTGELQKIENAKIVDSILEQLAA